MADSTDEEYQQTLHKAVQVSLNWIQDILTELELFADDFCEGLSEHLLAGIEDEVKEQSHQILVIFKEGKEFLDNNQDIVLDFDLHDLHNKWNTLGNKLVVLRDGFLFSREVKPVSSNVNNKVLQRANTLPFGISLKECSEIYCVKSFPCLFSCQCRIHVNRRLCPRCNRTKEYCQRNADKSWRFRSFCQHQDLKSPPELLTSENPELLTGENLIASKEFASLSNNVSDHSSLSSCLLCSHLQLHVSSDSLCEYHSPVDDCIRYLEETAEESFCSLDLPDHQKFSKVCNIASAPELSCANFSMSIDSDTMSSSPNYTPFKHDSKSQTKRRLSEPSRRIHHQDDLWPLIRHDYQYVMDTQLIETCREANGELSWDDEDLPSTCSCSFTEFINHYKELSDWLNNIQATLSHADKTRNGVNVRLNKMEEMKRNAVRKQSFNEQGGKLCKRYPEMKDEITKYVSLLNNKWDSLEQTISPRKAMRDEETMLKDLDGEIHKLRKWLREIENKLRTQVIKSCWTLAELEERYKAHQVLQKDIESHAKIVSSVLQLCERLQLDQRACCSQHDRDSVRQVAINLERRWHAIWLQSLEWQCRLEHQISKKTGFIPPSNLDLCFSYEPVKKCRRLNSDRSVHDHYDASQTTSPLSPLSEGTDIIPFSENEYEKISDNNMDSLDEMPSEFGQRVESYKPPFQDRETETDDILSMPNWLKSTNDKGVMVGSTGIDELKSTTSGSLGRPEIIQDVGYSSESSVHFSNDEKQETTLGPYGESPVESYEAIVKERTYQIRNSISLTSINCNKLTSLDVNPNEENRTNTFKSCTNNSLSHLYSSPADSYYKMTPVDLDCAPENLEISDSEVLTLKDQNNLNFKDSIRTKLNFDILDTESHGGSMPSSNIDYKMEEQNKLGSQNFDISDGWDLSDIELTKSLNSPVVKMCTDDIIEKDTVHEGESVKMELGILDSNYKSTPIPIKAKNKGDRNLLGSNNSEMTKIKIKDKVIRPKNKASANRLASLIMDSSCDASGEYTSNDSDDEESVSSSDDSIDDVHNVVLKEVQASPKDNMSKENALNNSLSIQDHENKVVLRGKKRRNSDRPLSVTELYQLSNRIDLTPFSISEGALNDLSNSSMSSSYTLTHSLSMEESYRESTKEGSPNSRKKYRKFKVRGRRFGNSESEGDPNASVNLSSFSHCQNASPNFNQDKLSMECFSPKLASPNSNGRPSQWVENIHQSSSTEKIQSEGTAIGDTENETRKQAGAESATSDRLGQSEDVCVDSSVSDQVWDNYQDPPYPSDIYSENLDDTEVKKLLEFGDDYQAFLDSQSDAGSARLPPTVIRRSPTKARLNSECSKGLSSSGFLVDSNANDSDSDLEDLHHVIEETQGQLQYAESVLNKHNREFLEIGVHLDPQKYAELIATCQTNIKCLQVIAQHIGTEPSEYLDLVTAIVQRWEVLHVQVVDRQKQVRQLVDIQKEIQRLKNILTEMESHVNSPSDSFTNLQSLENYIKDCQADCSNLHDHKQALKGINLQLHHFISENIVVNSAAHFKNDVEVLYLLWDSLHEKYRNKTNHLQCLHSKWENYNTLCKELLTILLQKQRKLNLLSISHEFPMNIAPSVDTKSSNIQGLDDELEFCRRKLEPLEQLSAELLVSLQSEEARQQVKCSLLQVNTELQTLQTKYQDLQPRIYHFKQRKSSESANSSWDKRTQIRSSSGVRWIPANHKSLIWRVIRAAVPIQFAIVVLYCLACLLEPHCCDSLNNYHFTLTPQLHYRYGPPPV